MTHTVSEKIDCRMCGGNRPLTPDGKRCLGCGTPVQNAIVRAKPASPNRTPPCPRCNSAGPHQEIEAERWACKHCGSVFEKLEGVAQVIVDAAERKVRKGTHRR